ncbi:hypothetical protein Ahy_B05g079112 [Arachis hypogaea]|uniref:Uncharacterized protein n=1 Tax=Arachis hypogaea TaxID=3818 RepID=A0A444Z902_ARAHY|nr:hypothetical protein Ahy_B05g079112 [Arachis hypogaea]
MPRIVVENLRCLPSLLCIAVNFMTHFKNKDLKKVPVTTIYSKSHRFGFIITNISKYINAVTRATRNLSIIALVKSTYFRLGKFFTRKDKEAQSLPQMTLVKAIEFNSKHVNIMNIC